MVWFTDKRGILEHCGKNEKDVRWLDRAIKKGVVWHDVEDTGAYILCTEYIRELEEENVKLMVKAGLVPGYILAEDAEKLKEVEKSDYTPSVEAAVKGVIESIQGGDVEESNKRIKELESDVKYLNKEYEKMEEKLNNYQEAIRNCYKWARDVKKDKTTWPVFKKDILKLEEDISGEDNQ